MRHKKSRNLSQTETKRFAAHQNQLPMVLGVLALLTVLIVLLTGLFHPQATTITHAQQRLSAAQLATLPEAPATNDIKAVNEEIEKGNEISDDSQTATIAGGDACSWSNSVNIPVNNLDSGAAAVGSNLFLFGGNSGGITANAYKFDGTAWTAIAPLPVTLTRPGVVSDGTSVYVVNGISAGSTTSATSLYRYNPATNDYTTLAPSPTGVWTPAVTFYNGKIYKIGGVVTAGTSNTSTTAVEIYDIASNTWSTGAAYPTSVGFASAFTLGNFIYGAGGITLPSPPGVVTAKTYRYDPAANTWDDAAIADLPAARFGAANATYRGGLIIAGGFVGDPAAPTNSVIQWNSTTNAWVDYPNLPAARTRSAGVVYAEGFHVIGGSGAPFSFTGTNTNFRLFCPPTDAPFLTGNVTYVSENGTPANNTPDPGETVTVALNLQNVGGVATGGSVTATLAATGGIVPVTTSQNYGTIAPNATVSRNFTFTVPASAVCGSQITLTFNIQDGSTNYSVTRTYTLGTRSAIFSENFDGVTAPALPAGWTQVATGSNTGWVTSTTTPDSAPNAVFAPDLATPGGADLESPVINVPAGGAILNFRINYNTEPTWDGGILEIKVGSGAYQDIIATGVTFTTGGYNSTVRGTGNPLGETSRPAWSGNSNGYIDASVPLPAAANGQPVQLKWRIGHDNTIGGVGIRVDNITVQGPFQCATVGGSVAPTNSRADFDGDGRTDVSVFRGGQWFAQRSTAGFIGVNWGAAGDQLAPGDYNGDNKTDFAIYRPTATAGAADFYVLLSETNTFSGVEWGTTGDIVKVGDYDGNNRDDYAIYRPSANAWYILTNPGFTFITYTVGAAGGTPVQLDFDGDGRTDPASWVPASGLWTIRRSSDGTTVSFNWGTTGDIPVPADYLGNDNRDEVVVFRAGQWLVRLDNGQLAVINWGAATDIPVPGDYDGDGRDDQAVYRGGTWFVLGTTSNLTTTFGAAGDIPVPRAYTPNN